MEQGLNLLLYLEIGERMSTTMVPRFEARQARYLAGHRQHPMSRCLRSDIPSGAYIFENPHELSKVEMELQRIDRGFEILFDRFTQDHGGLQPAYHLYRRLNTAGSGGNAYDELVLEFSLQKDIDMQWPLGEPCQPGMWLVETVKKRDRARYSSNAEEAFAVETARDQAEREAAEKARNAPAVEAIEQFQREVVERKHREIKPLPNANRRRGPKGKKLTTY